MSSLIPLVVLVPLVGAACGVLAGRWRSAQQWIGVTCLTATCALSVALLVSVDRDGPLVTQAGGWPAPLGISLVVDRFAGIMLVVSSSMLLAVLLYAVAQGGVAVERVAFHPVYLVLAAGVAASFVTGDLFNLFVAFEMMLSASYVLITMGGRPDQVRAGMTYVVISLIASAVFVTLLALVYASTGTVNMADLAERMQLLSPRVADSLALMMILVFGIKAALFPLFFWLPDSYPTAPGPVTAIFAGLLTKVGVYAIIRTQTTVVPEDARQGTFLLVLASLTMIVGILGAIAQDDMKRILSFNLISHIGFMVFGLGLFSLAGIAGAIFYTVHHIIVKTTLFLVAGLVERIGGSSRLSEVGGMVRRAPLVALLFALPALSLSGLPPFSGFVGKLALIDAGTAAGTWAVVAASLVASLLTLFSMSKVWAGVFWGEPEAPPTHTPVSNLCDRGTVGMAVWTAVLVVVGLALAWFAGPMWELAERAADDLLHPQRYIDLVLGGSS